MIFLKFGFDKIKKVSIKMIYLLNLSIHTEIVFHKEIFFEIFIYGRKVEDLLEETEKASFKLCFDKI